MADPVYEVVVGESLPDLSLWVTVDKQLLTDLGSNAFFSLLVRDPDDTVTLFNKLTGFLGQVGEGTERNGFPNLIVQWGGSGELDQLTPDRTHKALLTITRVSDEKIRYYRFVIKATAVPGG